MIHRFLNSQEIHIHETWYLSTRIHLIIGLIGFQIIIEVLIGQGKIVEALRLASTLPGSENVSARKYLEAAKKISDPLVFYSVYTWFQQRNIRARGSPDFLRSIIQFIKRFDCFK